MKNAREIFNRAKSAAQRVADNPKTVALREKAKEYGRNLPESIKATTEQVNKVGQQQLKKTLNDVASGVRTMAEGLGEKKSGEKSMEEKAPLPKSPQIMKLENKQPELPKVETTKPKWLIDSKKSAPLVMKKSAVAVETSDTPLTESKTTAHESHTTSTDRQAVTILPRESEKLPEKTKMTSVFRQKTLNLAAMTKKAGARYGSNVVEKLESTLDRPREILDTRKRNYETLKGRILLSRNMWLTAAAVGIVATLVGTFYTYEAILIQRRNNEF